MMFYHNMFVSGGGGCDALREKPFFLMMMYSKSRVTGRKDNTAVSFLTLLIYKFDIECFSRSE